jgi:hypothetical protein
VPRVCLPGQIATWPIASRAVPRHDGRRPRRRGGQGDNLPGFGAVAGRGRIDIRLAEDNDGELYVLTKGDGMIREFRSVNQAR